LIFSSSSSSLPFTVSVCSLFAHFQSSERGTYQRHSEAPLSLSLCLSPRAATTRQFLSLLTSSYSLPTLFLHFSQIGVALRPYFLRAVECPKCIAAGDSLAFRSRSNIPGRFDGIREVFVSVLALS